ncbi:hypothetical protein RIF29_19774 [Crotalaria pallida]|uniref:Uncharacterized protein n=1 Tax=Crotalaria pallida TaxID=3830 RepID=A0AAN9F2C3_CROPI
MVKEGVIPAERVDVSELHPIVAESTKNPPNNPKEKPTKEEQWHTVTTRRRAMQQRNKNDDSNIVVENGRESPSVPANG